MRAFVDTNVLVYSQSNDGEKTAKAIILLEQYPVISTQVINEAISVLTRKCGVSRQNAYELADLWLDACEVESVTVSTIRQAMLLTQKHMLSHWDALIVAAALFVLVQWQPTISMAFAAIVIISREITVSALREWMAELGARTSVAV